MPRLETNLSRCLQCSELKDVKFLILSSASCLFISEIKRLIKTSVTLKNKINEDYQELVE